MSKSMLASACAALSMLAPHLGASQAARRDSADSPTRPVISEAISPLERITPVARDEYQGDGFLRKPPGAGPFPAVLIIHPGLTTFATERLKDITLNAAQPSRFLAAGYVVAVVTYRSRDEDPQTTVSLADALGAVEHLRKLASVDAKSIVLFGCSGGGDLSLEVAAATDVAAIAPEEPASILFTGTFNTSIPKTGERYTPADAQVVVTDPSRYYTPQKQKLTREKISRIHSPILILQGDQQALNGFNRQVLIPELRAMGKRLEVITYPGEPHCFAFDGRTPRTPRPAAALKAFQDADAFFRRYVRTKPVPIDPSLVTYVRVP